MRPVAEADFIRDVSGPQLSDFEHSGRGRSLAHGRSIAHITLR